MSKWGLPSFLALAVICVLLFQNCGGYQALHLPRSEDNQSVDQPEEKDPISETDSGFLSPYDFPGTTLSNSEKQSLTDAIGSGVYVPIKTFYSSLEDLYTDFNINPSHIQNCDDRNTYLLKSKATPFKNAAELYFCTGEFNTAECRSTSYKKVHLNYCLDLEDSMDWVAIQAALLNANGRTVTLPPRKSFLVNQAIVLPSNTKLVWQGVGENTIGGFAYRAKEASFIRWVKKTAPETPGIWGPNGFTIGSVFHNGDMPFIYSGEYASRTISITKNISLFFPMIDVGNSPGENGISFGHGSDGALIYGGTIRNVKIKKDIAGGKAVQCEAGCRNLKIEGLEILNSFIGINANSLTRFKHLQKFSSGEISSLEAKNISMDNVDVPLNFMDDMAEEDTQRVLVENFVFRNSGRVSGAVETDLFGSTSEVFMPTSLSTAKIKSETALGEEVPKYSFKYGGLMTGNGGKNITVRNGELINSEQYPALRGLVLGYFSNSFIENVSYTIKIDCQIRTNRTVHPSCS